MDCDTPCKIEIVQIHNNNNRKRKYPMQSVSRYLILTGSARISACLVESLQKIANMAPNDNEPRIGAILNECETREHLTNNVVMLCCS
jgi:hypothetical protein